MPGVGRVVDGESAAELSRPTLAAPVMLSELPNTAPGRQRGSGDGASGCERCAGDCAQGVHARREHVRAVHVVAQQLSQPTSFMLRTKGRPLAKSASRSSEWKARSCPRLLVP